MRDLDLTSLRLFVATCDHRNIARAGLQAHIGASAISKRLAQLEEAVGAPLLERQRRGVVPTAAGELMRGPCWRLRTGWRATWPTTDGA